MDNLSTPYLALLRSSGFKLTPKRRSVINLFLKERATLTPRQVYAKVRRVVTPLGLPTIYRILEELAAVGVLVSVVSGERFLAYALCSRPQEHHHHFICRRCQKIEEVDFCGIDRAGRTIEKALGCRIEAHLFQVEGLCGNCLKNDRKGSGDA